MTNQQKIERFKKITTEMAELYAKKNSNYGDSFGKLYKDLGPIAGLVPLHNKLDRLTNLIQGGSNDFESIEDTFIDLANYAIMNLIEFEKDEDIVAPDNKEEEIASPSSIPKPEEGKIDYFEQKPIWSGISISNNLCAFCKRKNTTDCYNCKHFNIAYCTYSTTTPAGSSDISSYCSKESK